MDRELENLLLQTKYEIVQLRKENEIMKARWEGIDIAMQLLYATPPTKSGVNMSEDIAYKIDRYITDKKDK